MSGDTVPSYSHTQRAPWHLALDALGAVLLVAAWFSSEAIQIRLLFVGMAVLFLLLGASFRQLTVQDRGDHIEVGFGPLPLFRRRVRYEDVEGVEVGKTTLLDGWGIHMSLRGGWVWNIWGFDCVVIRVKRSTLRVGTDDAPGLAKFLNQRKSV